MSHPIVPQILELANPIAQELGLEVVEVVFQTNKRPPVLRLDIRNRESDTSLNDCERMSRALEATLDGSEVIRESYVLEISSPGISRQLTNEREFTTFKGFAVTITTQTDTGKKEWRGKLQGRDEEAIYINQKGKAIAIPRDCVTKVQLDEQR